MTRFSIGDKSIELSFNPITAVFKYIDTHKTSLSALHLEDTSCGLHGLKASKSPGRIATAIPNFRKQQYATTQSR